MSKGPAQILSRDELAATVKELKAAGKRIVFTNGTFDLLHVGHLRSLSGAAEHGDVVIVALNSDSSVKSYKGPNLPIQPQDERAELLSWLRCVDYITIFDEPTVDALLRLLEPHVHAKGTEYDAKTIPERESVMSYGGEIAIVGDAKAHSTSWLIKRIRELPE